MNTRIPPYTRLAAVLGVALLPLLAHAEPAQADAACRHGKMMERHDGHAAPHGMHEGRGGFGWYHGHGIARQLQRLDLSEAQRDQVFSILHQQAPELREKHKALHQARKELHALALSDAFDDAKARALADAVARSSAQIGYLQARTSQRLYALLTPQQKQELQARMNKRRSFHQPTRGDAPPAGHPARAL